MRALVTGGAGFIGSHVAEHLLKEGKEVVVVDDLTGGFRENVPEGAVFVEGSVVDRDLLKELFERYSFNQVYHLAAYAAEGLSHFIRHFNYTNNLIGSINLINLSILHEIDCFVFTSSIAVYGRNQLPMTEDTLPLPEDPYGIAKLAVENDLRSAHDMFGLDYVVFRPHNVYGERQNIGDKYRNVIGIFMNQIMRGEPMTVFGDGEQTRAFSYISDVAPQIARAPFVESARNQIFNIGADTPYTVNELASVVAQAMGAEPYIKHLDSRNEVVDAYADHSKASSVFGEQAPVDLVEGIGRMAKWAALAGAKSSDTFENIEVRKKLPPTWA
jgi:UDP-glucose 4-epimerase